MDSSNIRFASLLLSGIAIGIGSLLIGQSYARLHSSIGLDAPRVLPVAQMEMISGSVLIAGGMVALAIVVSSPSSPRRSNEN